MIESLEQRTLLHATLLNGVLTVSGTQFDDVIQISLQTTNIIVQHLTDSLNQTFDAFLVNRIEVNLGDGRDRLTVASNIDKPVLASGGDGRDRIVTGAGRDTLQGGSGGDALSGGAGRDQLNGGRGNDALNGGDGTDVLDGSSGGDILVGGTGLDTADYRRRRGNLVITVGDTNNDDGEQDEGDSVRADVEVIRAGRGNDKVTGDAGGQQIFGGAGNDTLTGGDGADSLHGEGGTDRLVADDGVRDVVNGASVGNEDDSKNDVAVVDDLDLVRGVEQIL